MPRRREVPAVPPAFSPARIPSASQGSGRRISRRTIFRCSTAGTRPTRSKHSFERDSPRNSPREFLRLTATGSLHLSRRDSVHERKLVKDELQIFFRTSHRSLRLEPLVDNLTALREQAALHDFVVEIHLEFFGFLVVEARVRKECGDVSTEHL